MVLFEVDGDKIKVLYYRSGSNNTVMINKIML